MSLMDLLFQNGNLHSLAKTQKLTLLTLLRVTASMRLALLHPAQGNAVPIPSNWLQAASIGFPLLSPETNNCQYMDPGTSIHTLCDMLQIDPRNLLLPSDSIMDQEQPVVRIAIYHGEHERVHLGNLAAQGLVVPSLRQALCLLVLRRLVYGVCIYPAGIWFSSGQQVSPVRLIEKDGSIQISLEMHDTGMTVLICLCKTS